MKKRIFSRVLALVMAMSLLGTTAFAACFTDLQEAASTEFTPTTETEVPETPAATDEHANGTQFTTDDGQTRYGFAWNESGSIWGIHAWDQDGVRNVLLNEDVKYDAAEDAERPSILIGSGKDVTIDLNSQAIDGGNHEGLSGTRSAIFDVYGTGVLTVKDTSENGIGKITGGGTTSGSVRNDTCKGSGVVVSGSGTFNLENGNITDNGKTGGAGVFVEQNASFNMRGGSVSDNTGRGIVCYTNAEANVNITGGTISGNKGTGIVSGGYWNATTHMYGKGNVSIENAVIVNNECSGIEIVGTGTVTLEDGAEVHDNTVGSTKVDIYAHKSKEQKSTLYGTGAALKAPGMQFIGWYTLSGTKYAAEGTVNGDVFLVSKWKGYTYKVIVDPNGGTLPAGSVESAEYTYGGESTPMIPGEPAKEGYIFTEWTVTDKDGNPIALDKFIPSEDGETITITAGWTPVDDDDDDNTSDDTGNGAGGITTPDADIPLGDLPAAGADTTAIEDEEVPLAGLFTRADAIGYLWEQSGSPEAELSDFEDVPEDHYWAVAIGWAQDMGIALPDEDGNFRPDDMVLRASDEPEGELQEFLNRYAVFAGIELEDGERFIELDGATDDVIFGEDAQVIFDDFFAKLEAALSAKAA